MAYVKIMFQDSPSTATPLNAENLNHMDDQIALNDQRLTEIETSYVKSFNGRTGNVVPEKGDYDINQIVASDGQDGYIPVWRNNGTEQEPDWGFAMEEQGGSGHEIQNQSGTLLPQEDILQFPDSHVSDDSTNGRTIVENIKEHTTASDYEQATEDGFHVIDDGNDVPIGASSEDKVEIVADGNTTWGTLFDSLFNDEHFDVTKVTKNALLVIDNNVLQISWNETTELDFYSVPTINASNVVMLYARLQSSGSTYFSATNGTPSSKTSQNAPQGSKITLYYGTSSSIIELNTDARHCMMSDGQSVEGALTWKYVANVTNHNAISIPTVAREIFCVGVFGNLSVMFPTVVGNARSGYYSSANDNGDIYVAYSASNKQLVVTNYLINGLDVISQGVRVYYR